MQFLSFLSRHSPALSRVTHPSLSSSQLLSLNSRLSSLRTPSVSPSGGGVVGSGSVGCGSGRGVVVALVSLVRVMVDQVIFGAA